MKRYRGRRPGRSHWDWWTGNVQLAMAVAVLAVVAVCAFGAGWMAAARWLM